MTKPRRAAAGAAMLTLVLLILAATPTPASAHADFVSSTPSPYDIWNKAPTYVSVTVSEAVQPGSPTISVTNSTNVRVDTGPTQLSASDPTTFTVHLLNGIAPSVYTVTWTVVSADDGHFTAGTFYFMVTTPGGPLPGHWPQTGALGINQPISPWDVALRAADFVGFSIAFGGTLLGALLWIPGTAALDERERKGPMDGLRALVRFSRIGALLFAAADVGMWISNLLLSPPADLAGIFGSLFLLSLALRFLLGLSIALLLTRILMRPDSARGIEERPPEFLLTIFSCFLVILLEVAASHSAVIGPWWPLGPVADATHLYGAALWAGGLLGILRIRRWLREPTPPAFSAEVLRAFSRFAFLGVVLVVSAGVVLGIVLVGTLDALVGTEYGWVILAKGAVLVPMVALGAWNRRTLRREGSSEQGMPRAVARLARNVRAEALLGAAVLVLAGLLVTMNPATAARPQNLTFTLDATNGGLYAIFEMDPWPETPGSYVFQLSVYYAGNNTAYMQGGNGTLSFLLEGGNGTWVTLPLAGPHGNHYFVDSGILNQPGIWQLQAQIRGPLGTPVDFTFVVTLHR